MKKISIVFTIISLCCFTVALAVPTGKTLDFSNSWMGNVKFSGKIHQKAGIKCKECHDKNVFPKMKSGSVKTTMTDIYAGKLCGVCHNGQRAFAPKPNCNRCHIKP